eukprot:TRINITY_DN6019_c0_g1_i3.p1 TRINITY_DN6019_c0_g1~~TRINITY_DN6019_c0_g1_i3.p1  ORF type:complete len:293 (-),score=75.43 TRINITY_DN6019_c0_g1_i3:256-1134(-)
MKRSIDDENDELERSENGISPHSSPLKPPSQSSPEKVHKRPIRRNKSINQPDFNAPTTLSESSQALLSINKDGKSAPKRGTDKKTSGRLSPTLSSLIYDEPEPKKVNNNETNHQQQDPVHCNDEPEWLPTTIFIGELNQYIEDDIFVQVFGRFGQIDNIRAMKGKNFAFLTFYHPESARRAVETMNGGTIMGGRVKVAIARNPNSKAYNPALGKKTGANLPRENHHYNYDRYPERNDHVDPKRMRREEPNHQHQGLKPATSYPEYSNPPQPTLRKKNLISYNIIIISKLSHF